MIADDFDGIAAEMRRIREEERKPAEQPNALLAIGKTLTDMGELWDVRRLPGEPDASLRKRLLDRMTDAVRNSR